MTRLRTAAALATVSLAGTSTVLGQSATQDVSITATVPKYCTVAGTATAAALYTTIPIDAAGRVSTAIQSFVVGTVVCNSVTSVVATSLVGGVKSATPVSAGFTNIINYTGMATFGEAVSAINTAFVPSAAGPEAGTVGITTGATAEVLTIAIFPARPWWPLAAGSDYADVLRITLTPQ